jgi:hypothetical protein
MMKLLIPVLLLFLASCDQSHLIDDEAARLRGDYLVQSYVINQDTLFAAGKINKIGVTDFKVIVSRKTADSLSIGYSWTMNQKPGALHIRQLHLTGGNGQYKLSMPSTAPFFYEGSISADIYSERTSLAGLGFVLLPENYPLEGTSDPGKGSVTIIAKRQQ